MKYKTYILNTVLAALLFVILLAAVIVRAFLPNVIIYSWSIPRMVLVSLAALLVDHYAAKGADRCYICVPVFSAIAFGLLTWCAGFAGAGEAVKVAVIGGVVFTVTTWLYTSIQDRLSSGPAVRIAPFLSAFGLYLAAQCFAGMWL